MIAAWHELNRDPKKRSTPFVAAEFNPYRKRRKRDSRPELTPEQFAELFKDG